MVHRLQGKVEGHKFDNRAQPRHCRTNRNTGKPKLGNWRVDNPLGAKFVQHSLRYLISALIFANLFTHQVNRVVAAHFLGHAFAQSLAHGHLLHLGALGPIRALRHRYGDGCGSLCGRFCRRRGRGRWRRGRSNCRRGVFAIFQKHRNRRVDFDAFGAFRDQNFTDDAFVNRFKFHRCLVGLDLGQNVTA